MFQQLADKTSVQNLKHKAHKTAARFNDKHIKLAVTGLSGSGKTAFITSLINQLLNAKVSHNLPFFSVLQNCRLMGVKRDQQPDLKLARFSYEAGMQNLTETPPQWPESTKGMSQVRLELKYKKVSGMGRFLTEDATLLLDITDYPGEWLLDLPLLELDFRCWSNLCYEQLQDSERLVLAKPFFEKLQLMDLNAEADDSALQQISEEYAKYLISCKGLGYELLQPGRFILPGELEGAPVLHFVPLLLAKHQDIDWDNIVKGSNLALMQQRFEHYKKHVVLPFYQQYFKHFDRQVVLVDCLGALNQGAQHLKELQLAIQSILESFRYGKSNILHRLFRPNIDKLMFAASKADRITSTQQQNLGKLLGNIIQETRAHIEFEGGDVESTCIAAVKSSRQGVVEHQGRQVTVIQGTSSHNESLTMYPGDVPDFYPDNKFMAQHKFSFPDLSPPELAGLKALPHIRMDTVLEYLLGDKLR